MASTLAAALLLKRLKVLTEKGQGRQEGKQC